MTERKRGRPRKADSPNVPWQEVDRLLVLGEKWTDEKTGAESVRYPSFADIAKRFGVSKSLIGKYSAKHNCSERKKEARARERIRYEQKVVEKRAESRALSTQDAIQIIDDCLRDFGERVQRGEVRLDNPADFNTLLRLKEFALGHADSRQEIHGMVSLEEIQARHKRLRDGFDGLAPEVSGAVAAQAGAADVAPKATEDGSTVH